MADWHGYFGIENIALNAAQKQTLITGLRQLGPTLSPQPAQLNHWRTRLDNDAAIFEALFDEDVLTIAALKQRLATIFSVSASNITHTTTNQSFGGGVTTIVTLAYQSTNRLRVGLFGGVGATWLTSQAEVLGYLAANAAQWEL